MLNQSQKADLEHLLAEVIHAATPADELALLRISLRAYMDGKDAREALRWAAEQLAHSIAHQ